MAFLDEFHQSFVPLQTPSLRDVALDTTGALFSIVLIWLKVTRGHISQGEGLSVLVSQFWDHMGDGDQYEKNQQVQQQLRS